MLRYDFTPCFLDVPYAAVALFGILLGGGSVWYLLEKKSKQPTEKDWHYFTKLVSAAFDF
jgi:ATP-binding cassette subfamily C (CFTR/MRP) protein 1